MSTENSRFWITYNGEIYNYLEIRKDLESSGYHFETNTDTEVLLKSYLHWGEGCLHQFNGMFSFVIWDDQEKIFFAARDRFGVKPLYYYQQGDKVAFASEIKQFKALKGWKNILNTEMADEYLYKEYCDHKHETLYKNVLQVLPGHYIKGDPFIKNAQPICWYALRNRIHPLHISDNEAVQRFQHLFEHAIRLRLRSDVSVGACLSGGVDSSSIVSMIRHIEGSKKEIPTFSSVFPGYKVDESHYIDELATRKKLTSYKNYPSLEEFLEQIDHMLYHQDLPFSGTSVFAQWKTFQSAQKKGVVVLLDGQGADESLLGYPRMLNGIIVDYAKKFSFIQILNFCKWQSVYNHQSIKNTILGGIQQRFQELYAFLLGLKNYKVPFQEDSLPTVEDVCLNHFSSSLQTLLRYEDRNSMAFSRESRLPFLDYRLVEFILSLSVNQRFRKTTTKWVLRESMRNLNIQSILDRKEKIGFATPEQDWFQKIHSTTNQPNFKTFIFNRWSANEKFLNLKSPLDKQNVNSLYE